MKTLRNLTEKQQEEVTAIMQADNCKRGVAVRKLNKILAAQEEAADAQLVDGLMELAPEGLSDEVTEVVDDLVSGEVVDVQAATPAEEQEAAALGVTPVIPPVAVAPAVKVVKVVVRQTQEVTNHNRAVGTSQYITAGSPKGQQFIHVYGPMGRKMTWVARTKAGVDEHQFQAALADAPLSHLTAAFRATIK